MAQAHVAASDPRISAAPVTYDQTTRRLTVAWGDGHMSRFAFVWLRHGTFLPALGRPELAELGLL